MQLGKPVGKEVWNSVVYSVIGPIRDSICNSVNNPAWKLVYNSERIPVSDSINSINDGTR